MIFLTVGTQLPFERLVRAVDDFAIRSKKEIFGQIGASSYVPRNFRCERFLGKQETDRLFSQAELIVAHAGMGSIISCLTHRVPLVILPRSHELGEHRNDHQQATARRFRDRKGIFVADDERDLQQILANSEVFDRPESIGEFAPESVLDRIRSALNF